MEDIKEGKDESEDEDAEDDDDESEDGSVIQRQKINGGMNSGKKNIIIEEEYSERQLLNDGSNFDDLSQ